MSATALYAQSDSQVKLIALSFDDGPDSLTTPAVIEKLKTYDVPASFFVVGNNINDQSAKYMKLAVKAGCEIQNHSKSHSDMTKLTPEQIKEEIIFTSKLIKKYTGKKPAFFRPPYISVNQTLYDNIDLTFICGYGCEDWKPEISAQQRAQTIIDGASHGSIILLHDMHGNSQTVDALDIIIPALKEKGYTFVTVSELFKLTGVKPVHGKIYTNLFK